MSKGSTKDFNWRGYELYHFDQPSGFGLYDYGDDLYKVKWPDGVASADYYNLTRAKEHAIIMARRWFETKSNSGESPTTAL